MQTIMEKMPAKISESEALVLSLYGHDIKSLSNAILEASRSLSAKFNSADMQNDPYIRDCIQLIHCASNSVMPLIDDLVSAGKNQIKSATIFPVAVYNLRHELEFASDTFAYEALAKKIDLSLCFTEEIPVVYCDIDNLRLHVINNILANAIRYTPVGGKIMISVEKSKASTMIIKISDSGMGIPATERESVFRKYRKSDKYRNVTSGKRGVSLYNALLCVEAHKGTLSIVDEPGFSGATFKIEIPLYSGCIQ